MMAHIHAPTIHCVPLYLLNSEIPRACPARGTDPWSRHSPSFWVRLMLIPALGTVARSLLQSASCNEEKLGIEVALMVLIASFFIGPPCASPFSRPCLFVSFRVYSRLGNQRNSNVGKGQFLGQKLKYFSPSELLHNKERAAPMFPQAARIAARSPQGANSPAAGNAIAPADKQLYGYCVRRRRGGGRGWGWEQRLSVSPKKKQV